MKYICALIGLVIASACSPDSNERRAPVEDQLTRPLEVARVDTSHPLPPVESQVEAPAQPQAKPAPAKAPRPIRKARTRVAKAPAAKPKEEDTTAAQGYAAPAPLPDTARVADTATAPSVNMATTAARDSADSSSADSARRVDTARRADTVVTTPQEISTASERSTSAPTTTDTLAARDTASTRPADTTIARDTARPVATRPLPPARDSSPVPPAPDTANSSPFATSASTAAARTLPIGTEIHAALDDSINSRKDTVGRVVTAVVMENVTGSDGKTLIAAGAPVRFTVSRLSPARSKSSQGRLRLKVEGVGVGGELRPVAADVKPIPHELRGRGVTAGDAAKVGVGAAGGAVLGKVIGKNTKGAVIGGVIGAAGGAVVASQTATRDVVVKARTPVVFVLTEPLVAQ